MGLALLTLLLCQAEITGKCVGVADGDTITVLSNEREIRVRLSGIDAPEKSQPFGNAARERLRELCHGKQVVVKTAGRDKYGRTIGEVLVDCESVNLRLLQEGQAWHYKRYDQTPEYAAAEIDAHEAKRGLWADDRAVPPWEWRRGKR